MSSPGVLDPKPLIRISSKKLDSFVAPDFWTSLSEEVRGLRETLENSEDDDEFSTAEHRAERASQIYKTGAILFQNSRSAKYAALPIPSLNVRTKLLHLYRYRVDSVYKILHWPTALSMFEANHVGSGNFSPSISSQTLEYSIYFMALCSVTDSEAEEMDLGIRPEMLQLYRPAVEDLFARSSLLQKPDLPILQAFSIYLVRLETLALSPRFCSVVANLNNLVRP